MKPLVNPLPGTRPAHRLWPTGSRGLARVQRLVIALAIPLVAFVMQFAFWGGVGPSAWALFYPAVFVAALLTDLAGGVLATLVAVGLGWYFFVPPYFSFAFDETGSLVSAVIFASTGLVFSVFSQRMRELGLRRATADADARLRTLLEHGADAVLVVSRAGRVTYANRQAAQMLGAPMEDLPGTALPAILAARGAGEPGDLAGQLTAAGQVRVECELKQRDGGTIAVEANGIELPDGDIFLSLRDIGERRREERIQAARIRLMEYAPGHSLHDLLVLTLDELGDLTGSPIGFFHFLEADQKTLSLQAWSTRTTRDYCKATGAGSHYDVDRAGVWADCVRTRRPVVHNDYPTLPGRHGLPAGHAELHREMVVPVFRQGLIVAITGVGNKETAYTAADLGTVERLADLAWDVAQIKRAEDALRESEERWKFALEAAGDGVWDWNLETGEVVFSRRWKEMLGFADDEIGTSFDEWQQRTHPDDLADALTTIRACASGETPGFRVEQRLRCKNGEWQWVLVRGRVVHSASDGRPLRMIATVSDIAARKEADLRISFMAYHDRLTGLPNRFLFFDRCAQALANARRKGLHVALLFVDLDDFKAVNDTHGHDAGDRVLKTVGARFLSCVRMVDTVARVGGDEFVLILGELSGALDATPVATRLLAAMEPPIDLPDGRDCRVGASIGISVYPDHGTETDTLLAAADAAMYRVKRAGGSRHAYCDEGTRVSAEDSGGRTRSD
jgi:diguanylate cyclase (GGDEF)-like protein/PAS domain S-box-containing protein